MRYLTALIITIILGLSNSSISVAQEGLFSSKSLTPETALKAATAALDKCRVEGYQVTVAVVDRMGTLQVLLRDRYAGAHTPATAHGKAWTAASFRTNSSDMVPLTQAGQPQSGVRHVPGALMVGGGMVIEAAGSIVGAIGVSGAPGGPQDDKCASAGIEAIQDLVAF